MRREDLLLALGTAASYAVPAAAAAGSPRGVGPEFAKYYASTDRFTCISAPSITLTLDQINDDFCDCPDGSDEPGTSACAHLSRLSPAQPYKSSDSSKNATLALPGFYCANAGHNPAYVPFTYINDGVCDYEACCDGSDEWAGVGGTKCANKCAEIGKEWRKHQEARVKSLTAATEQRQYLVEQASRLKLETQGMIKDLVNQIEGAEKKVEAAKKELERIEKTEKARGMQAAGDAGRAQMLARDAKSKMDAMSTLLLSLRSQRAQYLERLETLEATLTTFKEEYNPNFNDEGVKRAVQAWENYAAEGHERLDDEIQDQRITEFINGDYGINFDEYESGAAGADDDVQALYSLRQYLPETLRTFLDDQLTNLRQLLIDNGILKAPPVSPDAGESKAVRDARIRVTSAESELQQFTTSKKTQEESLTKDFGPDDVFRPLDGKCVQLDSGEYTYELCWMQEVTQISKKGGARQNMGHFEGFETTVVDDEERPDGKGLGRGERVVMKYENGNHCWNGPNRSTTVVLACAEKPEVWKVTEEEKCVYRMEAGTPAVCDKAAVGEMTEKQEAARKRDEL